MTILSPGFQLIDPSPGYPPGLTAAHFTGVSWNSRAKIVVSFKEHLKSALRIQQAHRCAYCHRPLGEHQDTHLEHIVEQSAWPRFTFEPQNIVLSCSRCNNQKLRSFVKISTAIRQRGGPHWTSCFLRVNPALFAAYPNQSADYRALHPHIDPFNVNFELWGGWIYKPRTAKGLRTIRLLEMNKIAAIEQRMRLERQKAYSSIPRILVRIADAAQHADVRRILTKYLCNVIFQMKKNIGV